MVDAEGHLDVKKLQKEMSESMFEDKRYHRTDEMKKKMITRAVRGNRKGHTHTNGRTPAYPDCRVV